MVVTYQKVVMYMLRHKGKILAVTPEKDAVAPEAMMTIAPSIHHDGVNRGALC